MSSDAVSARPGSQPESPIAARVTAWLAEGKPEAPDRIAECLASGDPAADVLRGMQNHAARLGGPGDLHPILVLDAAWDLLPILDVRARELLPAAARYLQRFEPRTLHPEWCEQAPLAESPVVYAGSLAEVLEAPDLQAAGAGIARILSVMQSEEAFHELLLEAAARHWEAPGWTLSGANAVVRALSQRRWKEGRDFVFRLVEALHRARIQRAGGIPGESRPLPFAAAFLAAARGARNLSAACLYLSHAFQVERTCRLKQRQVRHSIGQALEAWFPGLSAFPAGWRPAAQATEPASMETVDAHALLEHIGSGRVAEAEKEAAALGETGADADPIFGWLSLCAFGPLGEGDPTPLLLVDGARWGAHLLQGDRRELVARVARELASLR